MDGFQVVGRKNKISRRVNKTVLTCDSQSVKDFDIEKCKEKINSYRLELLCSDFSKKFFDVLQKTISIEEKNSSIEEMVVYGIGSISSSITAKYQLALVLLIIEKLQIKCYVYDPILVQKEMDLLQSFNINVIDKNEECKRLACIATMFFMLHCGKAMYNNLLWRNWSKQHLEKVYIIGNDFSSYEERLPARVFLETGKYIKQVLPYTLKNKIENCFVHDDIFNDTALHTFPENLLLQVSEKLWSENSEPTPIPDDVEIIRNTKILQ